MTRTINHHSSLEAFEITRTSEKREVLYRNGRVEEMFIRNVWVDANGKKFVMAKGKWCAVPETPECGYYSFVM